MAGQIQPRAIAYVRVSSVAGRGGDSFISPDVQEARARELASANGYAITAPAIRDLDESGGKWDRPGLQAALDAIRSGEASALIAATQSRIARDTRDLLNIHDEVVASGGRLIVGDLEITDNASGRMMMTMMAAIDEGYRNRASENFLEAKTRAVGKGIKVGRAPFGYDRDVETRRLVPNDDAEAVRELFRLAATGASHRQLSAFLYARTGTNRDWRSIAYLLRNRAYLGIVHVGTLENVDAHPAIVSPEEFAAAQRARSSTRGVKRSGTKSLLAGIARCGTCGRKMNKTESGNGKAVYRCPGISGVADPCTARASMLTRYVDEFVTEAVREWASAEGALGDVIETRPRADTYATAREALRLAEEERDAYAVETAGLGLPAKTIAAGLTARQEAVDAAREALDAVEVQDASIATRITIGEVWESATTEERRLLIASVIDHVVIRRAEGRGQAPGDRLAIVWR